MPTLMFAQTGPLYTGHYDLEWSINTNGADPDNEGSWSSKFIPPHGGNTSWIADPQIDKLSHDAVLTYDRAKRKAAYDEIQKILVDEEPYISLYHRDNVAIMRKNVDGFQMYPSGFLLSVPYMTVK